MTKQETIQVLQSIEDRAVKFPNMTACDWVAIAAAKRHLENSLEVKEVDLEKELDEWMKYGPHTNYPWCTIPDAIKITAEHFFELGIKAQKGE